MFSKTKKKPKMSLIREAIHEKSHQKTETKKIKELISKKNVAETALKAAKRKHHIELGDLMGKLEFLRDENTDLDDRLLQKEQELKTAENKFSESRSSSAAKRLNSIRRIQTQKYL